MTQVFTLRLDILLAECLYAIMRDSNPQGFFGGVLHCRMLLVCFWRGRAALSTVLCILPLIQRMKLIFVCSPWPLNQRLLC